MYLYNRYGIIVYCNIIKNSFYFFIKTLFNFLITTYLIITKYMCKKILKKNNYKFYYIHTHTHIHRSHIHDFFAVFFPVRNVKIAYMCKKLNKKKKINTQSWYFINYSMPASSKIFQIDVRNSYFLAPIHARNVATCSRYRYYDMHSIILLHVERRS